MARHRLTDGMSCYCRAPPPPFCRILPRQIDRGSPSNAAHASVAFATGASMMPSVKCGFTVRYAGMLPFACGVSPPLRACRYFMMIAAASCPPLRSATMVLRLRFCRAAPRDIDRSYMCSRGVTGVRCRQERRATAAMLMEISAVLPRCFTYAHKRRRALPAQKCDDFVKRDGPQVCRCYFLHVEFFKRNAGRALYV